MGTSASKACMKSDTNTTNTHQVVPLSVTRAGDLQGQEAHFRTPLASVCLQTIDMDTLDALKQISYGMSGWLSVTFQLDDSVSALPDNFMEDWSVLKCVDLRLTSVKRIGRSCLVQCRSLTSVDLPESLTEIGDHFLSYCARLQTVSLQQTSLRRIPDASFRACDTLTSVALPRSLTEIGDSVFAWCGHLSRIELHDTALQTIGSHFAELCEHLMTVRLPDTVTDVGEAFLRDSRRAEVVSGSAAVQAAFAEREKESDSTADPDNYPLF